MRAALGWLAWRPGLGDPSFMGWLTVAAYFAGAGMWFYYNRKAPAQKRKSGAILAYGLLVLGGNKLFNLSGAITAWLQMSAYEQNWYEQRRLVQAAFIFALLAISAALGVILLPRLASLSEGIRAALAGLAFLTILAVVRAASLHAVDALLYRPLAGIQLNWVLELAGIALSSLPALQVLKKTG